jgi:plastocyanin
MISRWLICFSALNNALVLSVAGAQVANLTGNIEITRTHRSKQSAENESAVVVWLQPALVDRARASSVLHARMRQHDKHFSPHILPIEVGTTVDFPNFDPIFHNAFSSFNGQIFDIGLYPPGSTRSVCFRRTGIVRVFCNIHSTMSAVILVLDTPYFVSQPRAGRFVLHNVPPGEYTLGLFDERAMPETLASLSRAVTVSPAGLDLGVIPISEADYLPLAHKNKYGVDYPPPPSEYPAKP